MPLLQRESPYYHWEFNEPTTGNLLRVVPERGGLVCGWRCAGRELIYLDLERFQDPNLSVRGGIPVLFPITGGLPNDNLPLPQGNYTLSQHGFARQMPWRIAPLADQTGVRLELTESAETLRVYPFPFSLVMDVRLAPMALAITTHVENKSDQPMPFSFGLHPYFNVSSLGGVKMEGLPEWCLNHHTMTEAPTTEQMAKLEAGVDVLVRPEGAVRLMDPEAGMTLELELTSPMDLAVIWTDPPRKMVCLEPWTGPRQALLSGDRKLELRPGNQCSLTTRYRLALTATTSRAS